MMPNKKPCVLLILDGWGHREQVDHNAIALAKTPHWDSLLSSCPHTIINASGSHVGLPSHQMGNSEVGHMSLGAGRTLYQDLQRINVAIDDHSFYKNAALKKAFKTAKKNGGKVHLIGLLSDGGVHSHLNHFLAMLNFAKAHELHHLYVHAFLDGRDCPPKSASNALELIHLWFKKNPIGKIASLIGRYYAMDRDQNFDRIQKAYDMLTLGQATHHVQDPAQGLLTAYTKEITDEFIEPTLIGQPALVEDGDTVIFMNFRSDRARQLSHAIQNPNFQGFKRTKIVKLKQFLTLTHYDETLDAIVAFKPQKITQTLGEIIQNQGLSQLRIAETEKYAHVTFFFNGGKETLFQNEERILVDSPNVLTYDQKPEMSAHEVTDHLVKAITEQTHDFIVCNYANADMVGHTGKMDATIKAVETLDLCLGRVVEALRAVDGEALITADHGNAELMQNIFTGQPHTAHTTELVPLVYVGSQTVTFSDQGCLTDIAATILKLMDIQKPKLMTGRSLIP